MYTEEELQQAAEHAELLARGESAPFEFNETTLRKYGWISGMGPDTCFSNRPEEATRQEVMLAYAMIFTEAGFIFKAQEIGEMVTVRLVAKRMER